MLMKVVVVTTAYLVLRNRIESGEEVVIGPDDRVQVKNTTIPPWARICSLKIKDANGGNWIGTGFLIGKRCVATAGHCVAINKKWVKEIEVIPGRNGSDKPYGSVISTQFRSTAGWVQNSDRNFDYGVIILPKNLGEQLGYFGFVDTSTMDVVGKMVNIAGYPGDKPAGTLWFDSNKIDSVTSTVLTYKVDTAGGQSGGTAYLHYPATTTQPARRYAIGIHTNGHPMGNSATRINADVYNNLKAWSIL